METYYQDDYTVLRKTCRVFRRGSTSGREYVGFMEAITNESVCNKMLRKRFLEPDTKRVIPTGGYTGDFKYSKKSLMLLV